MRRLGLILFCMALLFGAAQAEEFEECEDSLLFWSKLTYQGEAIDVTAPPPNYEPKHNGQEVKERFDLRYYSLFYRNRDVCDTLVWAGIEFCFMDGSPTYYDWIYNNDTIPTWSRYFNEMYFLGADKIEVDENGRNAFWDGLRFCGEPVDPSTPPPNYDPEMDYWRDVRESVGYAWYWGYYISEYENSHDDEECTSWNGIVFEVSEKPPSYPPHGEAGDVDPWYFNHQVRGYLELWEEYFNTIYDVPLEDHLYQDLRLYNELNHYAGYYIVDLGYSLLDWYTAAWNAKERAMADGIWLDSWSTKLNPFGSIGESISTKIKSKISAIAENPTVPFAIVVIVLGGLLVFDSRRRIRTEKSRLV